MNPSSIITKCTRNGRVSWQNVASMLGISQDDARRQYASTAKAMMSTQSQKTSGS